MSEKYFIVKFNTLDDLSLLKLHLEELEYTVYVKQNDKRLTIFSHQALQYILTFSGVFHIEMEWSKQTK